MTAFRAKNWFLVFTTVLATAALAGRSAASAKAATPLAATTTTASSTPAAPTAATTATAATAPTAAATSTAAAPAEANKLPATLGKGDCKGQPTFSSGETLGYFIWNDESGWHIRWTNKKKKVNFSGTIKSDAAFGKVKAMHAEGADFIKQVSDNTIKIDARSDKDVDGADFHPSPSSRYLTFDLMIGSAEATPHEVRLGAKKNRPASVPFTVDLEEGKTMSGKSTTKTK